MKTTIKIEADNSPSISTYNPNEIVKIAQFRKQIREATIMMTAMTPMPEFTMSTAPLPMETTVGTVEHPMGSTVSTNNRQLYEHHANNSLLYIKLDEIIKAANKDKCIHISVDAKLSPKQLEALTPTELGTNMSTDANSTIVKLYRPVDYKVVWWIKNKSIKEFLDESFFNIDIQTPGNESVTLYERYWDFSSINGNSGWNDITSKVLELMGSNTRYVGDGNTLCAIANTFLRSAGEYYSTYQYQGLTSNPFSINDRISAGYYNDSGFNNLFYTIYNETRGSYMISGVSSSYDREGYNFYSRGYDSMVLTGILSLSGRKFLLGFGADHRVVVSDTTYSDEPLLLKFINHAESSLVSSKPSAIDGEVFKADNVTNTNVLISINNKDGDAMAIRNDGIIIKSRSFRTSDNISDLNRPISHIFNASLNGFRSYEMENNENIKLFANSKPNLQAIVSDSETTRITTTMPTSVSGYSISINGL